MVWAGIQELLQASQRGDDSQLDECEELFATVLRHVRSGASGPPTAAGCRLRVRPRLAASEIVLWDPNAPESIVKRRFVSSFHNLIGERLAIGLRRPEPNFVDAVQRGCDLLVRVLPELGASVIPHLRLIGVLEGAGEVANVSRFDIPATVFFNANRFSSPWVTAEALLHEAAHCKLADLKKARSIHSLQDGAEGSPKIRPDWNRDIPNPAAQDEWDLTRGLYAFHFYVHSAFFFMLAECSEAPLTAEFGPPHKDLRNRFQTALDRAGRLSQSLQAAHEHFRPDSRSLILWLSQALQRLSNG